MSWWRRDRRTTTGARPTEVVDDDLVAWAVVAADVADRLRPAGAFAVALLGESLTRPRPSAWFGYEPDEAGLVGLLSRLGEDDVDVARLLAAEAPLSGRHLGVVPDEVADAWRQRLSDAARQAVAAGPLPDRSPAHLHAATVWDAAASAASEPPMVRLDPSVALSQLRWFPGVATRTFIGYSDPLNLSTVERATDEAGASAAQREAQAAARRVFEERVDPLRWRLSSLAYAAEHRPWEA